MTVKVIYHNMDGIDEPDDPTMPYVLRAKLRPPEFLFVAALLMYGNEECTIIGDSEAELQQVARDYGIAKNPRLISMSITRR